jgi:hypothetical protein
MAKAFLALGGIALVLALDLSRVQIPTTSTSERSVAFIGAGAGAAIGAAAAGGGTGAASGGIAGAATTPPPPPRY